MSDLKGFCIMYTYDVAVQDSLDEWDEAYTANRNQQSDLGDLIMVTGIRDGSVVEFDTYSDMVDYCHLNGWTIEGDDDEL